MKKSTRLSTILLTAIILLCTSAAYFGCRKVNSNKEELSQVQASTVSVIKEWLADQSKNLNTYQRRVLDSILSYAVWETAIQQTASNGKQLIYVPLGTHGVGLELFCNDNASIVDSGNIIKTHNIILDQEEMSPQLAMLCYYESMVLKKISPVQYTGQIRAYSLKNKFQYSYTFGAGDFISKSYYAPVNVMSIPKNMDVGKTPKVTGQHCDLMGLFAYYADGHTELVATWWECTDDGAPPATPPECLPPSEAVSIGSGISYIRMNSNCEPGGGGPTPTGPVVRVWNNLSHECLKKLLDRVMSNVNSLTNTLASQFTPGTGYALNYMERSIPNSSQPNLSPLTNGYVDPFFAPTSFRYINITLNQDIMPYHSQEYAAKVMLHEALHGFLTASNLSFNGADHITMGNFYVGMIADALHSMFPNLGELDRMALAWSGLENTFGAAWNSMHSTTQTGYINRSWEYRINGTLGTRAPVSGNCP